MFRYEIGIEAGNILVTKLGHEKRKVGGYRYWDIRYSILSNRLIFQGIKSIAAFKFDIWRITRKALVDGGCWGVAVAICGGATFPTTSPCVAIG